MPYCRSIEEIVETLQNAKNRKRSCTLLIGAGCSVKAGIPAARDFVKEIENRIPGKAVFYLHGQRHGFVHLHTEDELKQQSEFLKPVFEDARKRRTWIVAGYSGENDPVFDEHLAKVPQFDYSLFWIGYNDAEPATHVRDNLLQGGKDAYYVKGYDADGFFIKLTQELKIFPPDFLTKPFSHLNGILDTLTPFPADKGKGESDVTQPTKKRLAEVIQKYEKEPAQPVESEAGEAGISDALIDQVTRLYLEGEHDAVTDIYKQQIEGKKLPAELQDLIYWSYIEQGNVLLDQARTKQGAAADDLFQQAGEKYAAALEIKPDNKALNNWGTALHEQAKTKQGAAADRLFKQAGEKYAAALKIKPDNKALNNWGTALLYQSRLKQGEEKQKIYDKAKQVLERAEAVKPGSGSYNMACLTALQGDEDGCRKWLENCKTHGKLPSRKDMLEEADLESVRGRDWFREILKAAKE